MSIRFEVIGIEQFVEDFCGVDKTRARESSKEKGIKEAYKLFKKNFKHPVRATGGSAGYDIFSLRDFSLEPNEVVNLPTGFKVYMPNNVGMLIVPRSGLGFKYFVRLSNTIGVGDSDYSDNEKNEGHYWVKIRNEGLVSMQVKKGEAIAQSIFINYLLKDGDEYGKGNIRKGGFGSTTN